MSEFDILFKQALTKIFERLGSEATVSLNRYGLTKTAKVCQVDDIGTRTAYAMGYDSVVNSTLHYFDIYLPDLDGYLLSRDDEIVLGGKTYKVIALLNGDEYCVHFVASLE